MNLTELSAGNKYQSKRALREHYNVEMDFEKMDLRDTKRMLNRVRKLLGEARSSSSRHTSHESAAYLKMVMMESALSQHFNDLYRETEIVMENEEVEKSQVILAAQDMVDSLQKMMEEISKMNVEELPAVVNGIETEIDTSQSQSFNETVGAALTTLQSAISEAKTAVQGALGQITGQETAPVQDEFGPAIGEPGEDTEQSDQDLGDLPELPQGEPEEEEEASDIGRGLR